MPKASQIKHRSLKMSAPCHVSNSLLITTSHLPHHKNPRIFESQTSSVRCDAAAHPKQHGAGQSSFHCYDICIHLLQMPFRYKTNISPYHQDFEPHSCNIDVKHLGHEPALQIASFETCSHLFSFSEMATNMRFRKNQPQRCQSPRFFSGQGHPFLGDQPRKRGQPWSTLHPPTAPKTPLQASGPVEVSGFIETLR